MKRSFTCFLKILFALLIMSWNSSVHANPPPPYSGGDGSAGDPYQVANLSDLGYLSEHSEDWGFYFIQTADIDAAITSSWNSGEGFIPIGDVVINFTGSYDGQGHTISNLYINRPLSDDIGLFGNAPGDFIGPVVKNLGLLDVNITGQFYVGGIGGEVLWVENCYSTGSVSGIYFVGGIAGQIQLADQSYSACTVTGDNCGGFAGYNLGNITNCYSTGSVTGTTTLGGFVGTNDAGIIQYCYSIGNVSGSTDFGGFIGVNYFGIADDCFWNTETSGQASSTGSTPWPVNVFGKTTAEMKQVGTYLSDPGLITPWDFSLAGNIWAINGSDNNGYPFLRMESFTPGYIWLGTISTDWGDMDNWSEGALPGASDNVFIPDVLTNDPVLSGFAQMSWLVIEAGGSLNIASTGRLTPEDIENNAGTSGLILDSDASILTSSSGYPGTVKREIVNDGKWHFLSCPVDQTIMPEICDGKFAPFTFDFIPAVNITYDFFYWQEPPAVSNLNWINLKTSAGTVNTTDFGDPPRFMFGKGYLVEYSNNFTGDAMKSFEGELAGGGNIGIQVTYTTGGMWSGYNLAGNPFPSSLDWKDPLGWDRTVLAENGGGYDFWIWNDAVGNYGVYNSALPGDGGTNGISRYIPPTQAFFVKAVSDGDLGIASEARCHSTQDWLKTEANTLRISVTSAINQFSDEVLLSFNSFATGGSTKFFSMYEEAPAMYLPVENNNYSIRFLKDIGSNPAIPLNFKSGEDGNYSMTISGTESLPNVYLQDLKTGVFQDVKAQPAYTFVSSSTDDPGRFLIRFTPLGIDQVHSVKDIFVFDNVLNLNNPGKAIVTIYNMTGLKMLETQTSGEPVFRLSLQLSTGNYVVKVTNTTSTWSEKVFVK